jgi:exodeoxyribonuclease-3
MEEETTPRERGNACSTSREPILVESMTRILSWNVNGIRAVEKKGFGEWVAAESPDILCSRGPRRTLDCSPPSSLGSRTPRAGLQSFWASAKKPGYSGVAIYAKQKTLDVRPLGVADFDDDGAVIQDVLLRIHNLISAYFPNSQEAGARLPYNSPTATRCWRPAETRRFGSPLVLCGDYNIATRPSTGPAQGERREPGNAEERAWMDAFPAQFRRHVPTTPPRREGSIQLVVLSPSRREKNYRMEDRLPLRRRGAHAKVKKSVIRQDVWVPINAPWKSSLTSRIRRTVHK